MGLSWAIEFNDQLLFDTMLWEVPESIRNFIAIDINSGKSGKSRLNLHIVDESKSESEQTEATCP